MLNLCFMAVYSNRVRFGVNCLLLGILLSTTTESKANKFLLFFQCTDKESKPIADTIALAYNSNYPFLTLVRKNIVIHKKNLSKVHHIEVNALDLFFDRRRLYFEPGDTIRFQINAKGRVEISNKDKELHDFGIYKENPFYIRAKYPFQFLSDSIKMEEYVSYCEQYTNREKAYIDSIFGKRKPTLKKHLLEKSDFEFVVDLAKGFGKLPFSLKDSLFFISKAHEIKLSGVKPVFYDASYRIALGYYAEFIGGMIKEPVSALKFNTMVIVAKKHLNAHAYKCFLLSMLNRIANISTPDYDYVSRVIYTGLSKMNFSVTERAEISKKYKAIVVMSKQLNHFNQISLVNIKGEQLQLKDVLKDKKLYLFDFWASWCAPCIAEFPALKKISDAYQDVQVISISVDKDKAAWLNASEKHQLNADNYLIPNINRSQLLQNYQIEEVPRFLLFDSKGKCITANAPLPSDKHFEDYLKHLLAL